MILTTTRSNMSMISKTNRCNIWNILSIPCFTQLSTSESRINTVDIWRSIDTVLLKPLFLQIFQMCIQIAKKKTYLALLSKWTYFNSLIEENISLFKKTKKLKTTNKNLMLQTPSIFQDNLKNYEIIILLTKFWHFWVFLKLDL